ncbi:uncharacterized protein KIAA1522 homolog isoform X2 [Nerophis ophidion]|nr:uncharacterized protein KIAA1522 homolog isoform X2 [Nerophis ophidion]
MSNRDSLGFGELIPHDVVEIFAQEKHSNKGRKKRSHSLGRALGWLKGKKRKDLRAKGQNPGLGPALDLALDGHVAAHPSGNKGGHKSGRSSQTQGNSHAVLNLHEDDKTSPPPLLQENVFIEGSRPKYLEDLHSEALEGLKMMRQEETNPGVEFQDNESTISMMTVQTDGEGGGFTSDSTIPDAVSVKSSVSLRSSRSGLTRQESTFRPLSSGKPSEKGRTRRRRRKTTGIPQHVQRELGLDRVPSKFEREEGFNSEPCDSDHQGPLSVRQMKTNASHVDDLALLQRLGPDLLDGQRPQSVAFPSMTTTNSLQQERPSPVMLISPQATYMSKIIPNAVLPPSIEVVEISRGQSRNSLRTVSKSSLLLSSPSPSRTSCRTSSSKASKGTYSSHHNPYNSSDTSCWSHSDSSETLVSDSSTISSGNASRKDNCHDNETSSISKSSKVNFNGNLRINENGGKRDGHFRSLSVMKPKRAPPPPSRSYSLHNKMKRRSRDLAEAVDILKESSPQSVSALTGGTDEPEASPVTTMDSPGYNGDTSSLEDSTGSVLFNLSKLQQASESSKVGNTVSSSQGKREPLQDFRKIISPSSGYSSQDCTSPQLQAFSSSPKHKRGILAKLQRLFPSASAPSPLPQSETHENSKSMKDKMSQQDNVESASVSPSVRTLRELFDIPPHPKVHAPPAPPPEVWAHNKRTFELLLGPPAPDNVYAIIKKNPKDRRQQRASPCVSTSVSTEGSVRSLAGERKGNNQTVGATAGIAHALEIRKVEESALLNANEVHQIRNERLTQKVDLEGTGNVNEKDENVRVNDILNGMLVKAVEKREERLAAKKDKDKTSFTQSSEVKTKVDVIHTISLIRSTPSPSPPPAHLPPEPPGRQVNNAVSYDSSWPPPPPPIIQVVSVPDERDFPLPPPPLISEGGLIAPLPASPSKSVPAATIITELHSSSTTPSVVVVTEPELQRSETSHVVAPPPPSSIPPPPSYTAPPPPSYAAPPPPVTVATLSTITEVISPPSKDVPSPKPKKGSSPPPGEVTAFIAKAPLVQMLHSAITTNISPPLVKAKEDPSTEVAETISVQCSEVVAPAYSQESCLQSPEEETPVSNLNPPQSIPPPRPPIEPLKLLQRSLEAKIALQHETISSESQSEQISCSKILPPPQNVPPPPSLESLPAFKAASPNTDEVPANEALPMLQNEAIIPSSPEKPEEFTCSPPIGIPVPPPLPTGGLDSLLHPTSHVSTAKKSPEPSSPVQEESLRVVTPSLLQMVKLRPVKSSPEPPIAEEPAKAKDILTIQQLNDQVQTTLPNSEAPQKPIRRSLIILTPLPTSTSPPASLPTSPQPQSVVVPPAPTVLKSTVITSSPSMNLQEAIRMRTAARSNDSSAAPRLSFQLPTSPKDVCHSPTSTANFIFSKNNTRVVIETKPLGEISTTEINETELMKKVKKPPPVAKKPKTKAVDAEGSDAAQPESIMDSA